MASLNKIMLIGNLGKDPEIKTLESGVKVASFSIATSENWKDKEGNKQEKTEWHNIVLWRGLAEVAEKFLKKGNTVFIEGKSTTRSWDDKDGNKRYTTEVVGNNMQMMGGKQGGKKDNGDPGPTEGQQKQSIEMPKQNQGMEPDDMPF